MKKIITLILFLILSCSTAYGVTYHTYMANSLTGGVDGSLDNKDGTNLTDGDTATVITSTVTYHYILDADSGASEDSPNVISPDTNAGTKRWILSPVYNVGAFIMLGDSDIVSDIITAAQATPITRIQNDSTANVEYDLPTCSAGLTVWVEEDSAYTITLDPDASDNIQLLSSSPLTNGYSIVSTGDGYCKIRLTCKDDTTWKADSMICVWTSTGA